MATYNYTVTASGNSYYLWNGHGLVDAQNPDLFFRAGDTLTIVNTSGGHLMRIIPDNNPAGAVDASPGDDNANPYRAPSNTTFLYFEPVLEGAYTYVCTSHPAMTGSVTVSAAYTNEGPEDGYGTGPLIGHDDGPLSMNEIRTKINEIISKGGVGGTPGTGGGSISVSTDAPGSPSDGDLWWDEDAGSLYVYFAERSAWIQTNGAVGGSSTAVNVDAEFAANAAHMSGGGGWFCFDDSAANITATIHTNDTSSLSTGNGSGTGTDRAAVFTVPDSGFYQLNASIQLNVNTSTSISLLLHTGDTIPNGSPENLAAAGQVSGENQETLNFSGARYLNAGDKLYFEYTCSSANVPQLKGRLSIFKINAGGGGAGSGGDASIKVSDTAPDPAEDGDLWFNTTQAELYVYVDAENAWIQTNGAIGGGGGSQMHAFRTPNITYEGSYTYNYPAEWTGGLPDEVFVTTVYPSNNGSSTTHFQLVSFDATSVTIYCQNYNTSVADVFANILLVKNVGGGGAGPRAYAAFNPTAGATSTSASANISPDIYNSFNISSITDRGYFVYTGNQTGYRWTINLSNPVVNPIVHVSADNTATVGSYGLVPGSTTERYADIHANYHIEDNNTIHVFIVNVSGTGLPQDSYTHMSVTIF